MPPEPDPPVPILGEFVVATQLVRITFDKPLVVGVYDERNYFIRWVNVDRDPGSAAVAAPNPARLLITTAVVGADVGANICQYTAAAPDLIGQNGRMVAPFVQPLVAV